MYNVHNILVIEAAFVAWQHFRTYIYYKPSLPLLSTLNLTLQLSLYYNLPKSQINRLQQIQNCPARTMVKAIKSSHITPILRSLHWLKINEHIEYKLFSLTYKFSRPANVTTYTILHNLISVQSTC